MNKIILTIILFVTLIPAQSFANWTDPDQYWHLLTDAEKTTYFTQARQVISVRDGQNQLVRIILPRPATANLPAPLSRGAITTTGELVLQRKGLGVLAGRVIPYVGIALTAYMMKDDIRSLIEGDPDMWPGLKEIFYNPGNYTDLDQNSLAGLSYSTPYGDKTVTAIDSGGSCMTWEPWCAGISPWTCLATTNGQCSKVQYAWESGSNQKSWKQYYVQVAPFPTPRLATDSEIITASTATDGGMTEQANEDLDRLMADNPDKVKTDAPVQQPLEEKIASDAEDADQEADQKRDDAIQQLRDKCTIDGPGSQACIDLAKLEAEKAQDDADEKRRILEEEEQKKDEEMPSDDTATLNELNFDKFTELKNVLADKWPFSLLLTVSNTFSQLVAEPVAPTFDLHIYQDNVAHVSLEMFDSVATLLRWIWKFLMIGGCIWTLLYWWRGAN